MNEESNGTGGKDENGMTRRTFLKGVVAGAAAAGVLAMAPSVVSGSAEPAEDAQAERTLASTGDPIIVYVRDPRTGEVEIMAGTKSVVRRDLSLVNRLRASRSR